MHGLTLPNIGKISKKPERIDGKYKYEIDLKRVYKKSAYPNLGSKICITDNYSVPISYIDKIEIILASGNQYTIDKKIDNCYVIENKEVNSINLEDIIIIIADKEIDNYSIHFPKALGA